MGVTERAMDKNKRGCLWAGCGIAIVVVMVGVAVVGGAAWMVYQGSSIRVEHPEARQARDAFDDVRRRFGGQTPLVTMGLDGSAHVVPREDFGREPGGSTRAITSFHVMAWKPQDKELAHVELPFWLVRLGGAKGKFSVNGTDTLQDLAKLKVTFEDIEKAGPGLVFDQQQRDGAQVLIWTE
jgi:hypothetical protein